jgi:ferredoxin
MKVEVDRDVCAASGVCMMIAPDVFEPDDEGYARVSGDAGLGGALDAARRAELNCPSGAIRVQASGAAGPAGC